MKRNILEKFKEYHFEVKHITVLFMILFAFQLIVSFVNKASIRDFLTSTQDWYKQESAEEIANLTATSIELIYETVGEKSANSEHVKQVVQSFDIIFSQQQLTHNIDKLAIIVQHGNQHHIISDGLQLYAFLSNRDSLNGLSLAGDSSIISLYRSVKKELKSNEQIISIVNDSKTFHIFVPFVIKGEFLGALYMKSMPDFSSISTQVVGSLDETSVIYLSFITLGLLTMYFISSYTVKERDEAQKMLFEEHDKNLEKQITYQKELIFTKRIYHTHHKAEKIMGFIKEDLRVLSDENIDEIKARVLKYSNFISRVIYDMKWFDPPVQTIRNQLFRTNLNDVVNFIVMHIFDRVSAKTDAYKIQRELDPNVPVVFVNEFVIWEIIEPLVQNSIDHGTVNNLVVTIGTKYNQASGTSTLSISDNGLGIDASLLETNEEGIQNVFVENTTTKQQGMKTSGYGCYIAYEMTKRCGWEIKAANLPDQGCQFIITIKHERS